MIDSEIIRIAIEKAVSDCVDGIQLPGIVDAAVGNVAVSSEQVQQIAAHLEQHGHGEITISAEVELILRVTDTDALQSIVRTEFRVTVDADAENLRAVASPQIRQAQGGGDWPCGRAYLGDADQPPPSGCMFAAWGNSAAVRLTSGLVPASLSPPQMVRRSS